ncbi:MAG: enolase C-terminal domain-like protein [Pseudomonadales bacterium]|jgi:L-alanine-DL-glutamate epimerase-like enolase superfamily enzyme|nr:enolase C-terminal domain-like protein [Pseudomonadales bacterium]MDP6469601.1 enolase C-terminal domain-like protein [Pseudomonadales bacterium]MDP6827442.1 enolase C-terminal domain-like protein [Pseudomonadales bacterium]MDP6972196.1 enolase C-terminal domain-like protein [Pseudomonadales bacterium]|tara:strand:+ start:36 stop:1145 length:1110 start_codon:yes stop_codon:yes gene_type:complete
MRITDVKVTVWEWRDIPPTRYTLRVKSSGSRTAQMGLVRIITDAGIEGHAFLGSALSPLGNDARLIVDRYKPLLVGRDPLARERIWQTMATWAMGGVMRVIGAIDVALWDLAGKAAGVPVHRLIGSYRDTVPAYASSAVFETPEEYAEEAIRYKESGWTAYKIHPPATAALDIRICEAVREAVGDGYRIMLDSTWSYDYPDALRVGRAVEELGFYWYEDPLPYDNLYGYVKLKQVLAIPLMATEMPSTGPTSYAPWIMQQATDYLRGDVALKGGLTSCLKTAHLAEAFQMNYEVHHGGNSLNNVANLHLIMAIPNCEYFEVLLPDAVQKHGLIKDIEVDENGLVHAHHLPGLGAEIDFDLIENNKVAEL